MFEAARGDEHVPVPDDTELLPRARVERHRLLFAIAATLAAIPLLVLDNLSAQASPEKQVTADAPAAATATSAVVVEFEPVTTTTAAPTTTTPPTTAAPTTTAAPAPAPTIAPTTTTTIPPTTTTTAPPPSQRGQATWYEQPSDYPENGCAHRTLPFGTVVTVTNRGNGKSTTCRVNDRGPYEDGRIIDLDDDVFARIAPLDSGVISVVITW